MKMNKPLRRIGGLLAVSLAMLGCAKKTEVQNAENAPQHLMDSTGRDLGIVVFNCHRRFSAAVSSADPTAGIDNFAVRGIRGNDEYLAEAVPRSNAEAAANQFCDLGIMQ